MFFNFFDTSYWPLPLVPLYLLVSCTLLNVFGTQISQFSSFYPERDPFSPILSHHIFSSHPHNYTQLTLGWNRKFLPCHTNLSDRLSFPLALFVILVSMAPFPFSFLFGLEFPRDVSEICCFIVKLTRTGEGLLAGSLSESLWELAGESRKYWIPLKEVTILASQEG